MFAFPWRLSSIYLAFPTAKPAAAALSEFPISLIYVPRYSMYVPGVAVFINQLTYLLIGSRHVAQYRIARGPSFFHCIVSCRLPRSGIRIYICTNKHIYEVVAQSRNTDGLAGRQRSTIA